MTIQPEQGTTETTRRGSVLPDLGAIVVLCLAWVGMVLAIDPRGDFSINDDWAYGLPVRALVERGEFRFTFWQSMTLIAQVFWGWLFCLPAGYSFDALRLSTLVAGLIGVFGLYGLFRYYAATIPAALLGALIFAIDPLYIGVSCSFMTDIPFASLMLLSILLLARVLDGRGGRADIWLGFAAALIALFIRQLALAVFIGFLIASPIRYGFGRRWLVRGVLPLVVAGGSLALFTRFMKTTGRLPAAFFHKADTLKMVVMDLVHGHPGALKPALSASLITMMFTGLLATPWLALFAPSLLGQGSLKARRFRVGWVIGFSIVVTAALHATGRLMPMTGNILGDFKMGILSLPGVPPAGPPEIVWILVTWLASAGFAGLLLILFDLLSVILAIHDRDPETSRIRRQSLFLIVTGVAYFGPIGVPYQLMLDRYVLPILALFMAMTLLVPGIKLRRPPALAIAGSLGLTVVFAGYSVATIHDYFAWQRPAWAAFADLTEVQKIKPEEIDGSFEMNNQIPNWQTISTTSVDGDLVKDADRRPYAIAYSEMPDREVIGRRPVASWLPYSPREIFVLRRKQP